MPALQITTRPMSAPPGPRPEPGSSNGNANHAPASSTTNSRAGTPRSGTPVSTRPSAAAQLALGPKPTLEEEKIADLLALKTGSLPVSPESYQTIEPLIPIFLRHRKPILTSSSITGETLSEPPSTNVQYVYPSHVPTPDARCAPARLGDVQQSDRRIGGRGSEDEVWEREGDRETG